MRRHLPALAAATLTFLLATGCTGGDGVDVDLPDGERLLAAAADEMAQLESVTMTMSADAPLAELPVREVTGVITRTGDAEGTAQVEQFGQLLELRFVVINDTFHYQLVGSWSELPLADAAAFYDPSAVLDPERGVAQLLRSAADPQVVGRDGDRYEVTASFDATALAVLLPGAPEDTRGTVWIGVERPLLYAAEFPVPAGEGSAGSLTVTLSEFDQPTTISAP